MTKEVKMMKRKLINTAALIAALAPFAVHGQIATSQNFTLEKAVVASGGGASAGTTFSVTGTAGQSAAGDAAGTTFRLLGGFWSANLAPSAAGVFVAGRVTTPDGRPLRNAVVSLTDGDGQTVSTRTGSFGYYRFEGIRAGQSVVITVFSRRYQFAPRVLTINDDLADVDFVPLANDENE